METCETKKESRKGRGRALKIVEKSRKSRGEVSLAENFILAEKTTFRPKKNISLEKKGFAKKNLFLFKKRV